MKIHMMGAPMDLGQKRRGVDMGPSALRYAGLNQALAALGHDVHDLGDIRIPNPEEAVGDQRTQAVANVCEIIYSEGKRCVDQGFFALFLGGDHSISIGSVKAAAASSPETLGVIWIDAHADFNTPETSPSGNIHGMPVAVLTGDGAESLVSIGDGVTVPARNFVQIGIRDVDPTEAVRVNASDLNVFTMREIDTHGMATIADQTLGLLRHCDRIHVSLDLDSLEPAEAPGVGTPVQGGLSYREAHLLAEILSECGKVRSLDVVEVNPILDERNKTAILAVELITSMLGKKII
ncbi:MAG: arginase [Cellvibrionaceae bacterium]|jgi:arginase